MKKHGSVMRAFALAILIVMVILASAWTACPANQKPEVLARDGIATAKGFIEQQQTIHLAECQADPHKKVCEAINKAVAAQNLAINMLEVYCASPGFESGGVCVPDKTVEPKLREAMTILLDSVAEIKTLVSRDPPLKAGLGFLEVISLVLVMLNSLLASLGANPLYAGIAQSLQGAIGELSKARDEVLTKENLEALRTKPKW